MVDSCWIVDAPVPGASPRRGFIAKLHREAGCRRAERLRADFAASRGAVPHLRQSRGSRPDDGPRSAADLAALLNARLGTDVGLTDLRWVSYFLAQRGVVSALGAGRRFLLGDAGHLSSPMGGEGINSAPGARFPGWCDLDGATHHLVICGGAPPLDDFRTRWGALGSVVERTGASALAKQAGLGEGGIVLVRPDGFIGFRRPSADDEAIKSLDTHLSTYLQPNFAVAHKGAAHAR
jgi:hypothetical protein